MRWANHHRKQPARVLEDEMKSLILLACMFAAGCTAPLERRPAAAPTPTVGRFDAPVSRPAAPSSECISLDRTHRTWGAIGKFSGILSGASGLATVPLSDSEKGLRTGIALSAVVIAGIAVAAMYVEQDAAASWARDCGAP